MSALTLLKNENSKEHSKHGRSAERGASLHKMTTLKGMTAKFKSGMVLLFGGRVSELFDRTLYIDDIPNYFVYDLIR